MIPLAHVGHWIADLLYALPLVVMVGLVVAGRIRERRARRQGEVGHGGG